MEPPQKGCTPTRLALQAPVSTYQFDELATLTDDYLVDVLENARQDEGRDDRRARFVGLGIRAR